MGVDHSQLIRFKGITSTCYENKEVNERITPFLDIGFHLNIWKPIII